MTFVDLVIDTVVFGTANYVVMTVMGKIKKRQEEKKGSPPPGHYVGCLQHDLRRKGSGKKLEWINVRCMAYQSEFCKDGRCTFHCKKYCKCEDALR